MLTYIDDRICRWQRWKMARSQGLRMQNAHAVHLDPARVGAVLLSSRLVVGSMHAGLECHPARFDELGQFYVGCVEDGAGLIFAGGFVPDYSFGVPPMSFRTVWRSFMENPAYLARPRSPMPRACFGRRDVGALPETAGKIQAFTKVCFRSDRAHLHREGTKIQLRARARDA